MTQKKKKLKVAVKNGEWLDCNFSELELQLGLGLDLDLGLGLGLELVLEDGGSVMGEGGGCDEERDGSEGDEEEGVGKHKLGCKGKDEQFKYSGHSW